MTKKERIAELERKLAHAEKEIAGYKTKIDEYEAAQDAIPENCTPGKWCEACVFSGAVRLVQYDNDPYSPFSCSRVVNLRICKKGACENFVQKENPDANKPND